MFTQAVIIKALQEEKRNYSNLRKRTNEILSEYNMQLLSKDAFLISLNPLVASEVLTKKQILKKQTGQPVIYSITKGEYAQKQVELILEIGDAPKLIDYTRGILNQSEGAFEAIKNSIEKNKQGLFDKLNEDLIMIAEYVSHMIGKMILYQTKSLENLYLIKEIKRIERESRKLFDQAGVLSKKLGKKNHDEFIGTFDHGFTKELSTKYQKFLRDASMFKKD